MRGFGPGKLHPHRLPGGITNYVGDWKDAQGVRHRQSLGYRKDEARAALTRICHERDLQLAGLTGGSMACPYLVVVEKYLGSLKHRATSATIKNRTASLGRFQFTEVKFITHGAIDDWRAQRKASPRTINDDVSALQSALNHAARLELIPRNPLLGLRPLPTAGREKQKPRPLTIREQEALLVRVGEQDKGREFPQAPLMAFLLHTGARWSEACAVTRDAIGPEGAKLRATTTKNRTARVVPLSGDMRALLPKCVGPIFRTPEGKPWKTSSPSNFRRRILHKALKAAGIPRKTPDGVINVHALRHTFATHLARQGVPLQHAQYLLGHKSVRMTADIYTHLGPQDLGSSAAKVPDVSILAVKAT